MKSVLAALGLLAALCSPCWAGPCDTDLAELDASLAKAELPADVKAQLQDMRAQVKKLCDAGNEEEAADVLSDASSILASQ